MKIDKIKYRFLAERILANPAYLEEVKNWELNDLLNYASEEMTRVLVQVNSLHLAASPTNSNATIKPENFPDWNNVVMLEAYVQAEQAQRLGPKLKTDAIPEALSKMKRNSLPDHLSLENAVKESVDLSKIWALCAAQERPAFDISGNFIWETKNKSLLYAFAVAMDSRDLLKAGIKAQMFYFILCNKYGIEPASKVRALPNNASYGDAKDVFDDILKDSQKYLLPLLPPEAQEVPKI